MKTNGRTSAVLSAVLGFSMLLASISLISCSALKLSFQKYAPDPAFVATAQKVEVIKKGIFRTFYTVNDATDGSTIPFRVKKGWSTSQEMPKAPIALGQTSVKTKFRVVDLRTNDEFSTAAYISQKSLNTKIVNVSWGLNISLQMFRGKRAIGNLSLDGEDGYLITFNDRVWRAVKKQSIGFISGWELTRNDSLEAIIHLSDDGLFTDGYTIYFQPANHGLVQDYATLLILLNQTDDLERALKSKQK